MKPPDNPAPAPSDRCVLCDKHRALDSGMCHACGLAAQFRQEQEARLSLRTARGVKEEPVVKPRRKWLPK